MDAPPIQYVKTSDGYDIAYAVSGEGQPFVLMPWEMSHITIYWTQDTFLRPWLQGLAARFRLVQYDSRGQGMSSRGLPENLSLDDFRRDLEAVVERLRLRDFVLVAAIGICHVAVRYALANPERVRALVLASCAVDNAVWPEALYVSLAEQDWEAFLLSTAALNRASNLEASVARLKQVVSQRDWLARVRAELTSAEADLPRLRTPTLVLHPRDYLLNVETAMQVAAAIPNARMAVIDGTSNLGDHVQGLKAIDDFLATLPGPQAAHLPPDGLSARQVDVLRLIAAGKSNQQIADELVITLNTVQHHVSNILTKTGLANRTEAAAYAHRNGLV